MRRVLYVVSLILALAAPAVAESALEPRYSAISLHCYASLNPDGAVYLEPTSDYGIPHVAFEGRITLREGLVLGINAHLDAADLLFYRTEGGTGAWVGPFFQSDSTSYLGYSNPVQSGSVSCRLFDLEVGRALSVGGLKLLMLGGPSIIVIDTISSFYGDTDQTTAFREYVLQNGGTASILGCNLFLGLEGRLFFMNANVGMRFRYFEGSPGIKDFTGFLGHFEFKGGLGIYL